MATDTPPTDAGERRRSVVRSSPEVPFSGFYSRANAAAERRAAAARNAIIEWLGWTSDSHPTRRTRLRTRHYGWFLRKPRYWRTLRRAGARRPIPRDNRPSEVAEGSNRSKSPLGSPKWVPRGDFRCSRSRHARCSWACEHLRHDHEGGWTNFGAQRWPGTRVWRDFRLQ